MPHVSPWVGRAQKGRAGEDRADPGDGVDATTTPPATAIPAASNARTHAANVAPVVSTSSTSTAVPGATAGHRRTCT